MRRATQEHGPCIWTLYQKPQRSLRAGCFWIRWDEGCRAEIGTHSLLLSTASPPLQKLSLLLSHKTFQFSLLTPRCGYVCWACKMGWRIPNVFWRKPKVCLHGVLRKGHLTNWEFPNFLTFIDPQAKHKLSWFLAHMSPCADNKNLCVLYINCCVP